MYITWYVVNVAHKLILTCGKWISILFCAHNLKQNVETQNKCGKASLRVYNNSLFAQCFYFSAGDEEKGWFGKKY